jgi:hypothetical protein
MEKCCEGFWPVAIDNGWRPTAKCDVRRQACIVSLKAEALCVVQAENMAVTHCGIKAQILGIGLTAGVWGVLAFLDCNFDGQMLRNG